MFYSILFPSRELYDVPKRVAEPESFHDLFLDQVFAPIIKTKPYLDLGDLYFHKPRQIEVSEFRQRVALELDGDAELVTRLAAFSDEVLDCAIKMEDIQKLLTSEHKNEEKWKGGYLTRGELLNAAEKYVGVVESLAAYVEPKSFESLGLSEFREYLLTFSASTGFREFADRVRRIREGLTEVRYNMRIRNTTLRVRKFEGEIDRGTEILDLFRKFEQGGEKQYQITVSQGNLEPHVENEVLEMVARIYRDLFLDLDNFCAEYLHFVDETLRRFSREVQFYVLWNDFLAPMREAGLKFCYPTLVNGNEQIYVKAGFDVALGMRLRNAGIVTNDFELNAPERIIVVTGPNQGGKTTFATSFGQANYIASLGLAIPGESAQLREFDEIYSHFGKPEDDDMQNGQLRDDIVRLHHIMTNATSNSIIIVNEIYASTTLADALPLAIKMMDAIAELGCPAVVVTYLDELATHGAETVSMVFTVDENEPERRTFKIERGAPHGIAFAMQIAGRHNLTYEQFSRRLQAK
ncbi:MAG: hypothetical protein LBN02_02980 [Oscillospiraceae bacterium]|jgi:hypothetical protein|nr:hypothetical protein [Oscillospiraceae bacterium]